MSVTALHHASLIVADLDRARGFYETILGLTPNPDRPAKSFAGVWYDLGPQQIHLIVADEPDPMPPMTGTGYGGTQRHIALTVADLETIRQQLEQAGLPQVPSRSGRPVLFCQDFDGNFFELIAAA